MSQNPPALAVEPDTFSASLNLDNDVYVHVSARSMADLAEIVARIRPVAGLGNTAEKRPTASEKARQAAETAAPAPSPTPETPKASAGSAEKPAEEHNPLAQDNPVAEDPKKAFEEVRARIGVISKASRAATEEVLKKFGAKRASDLKVSDYARFMEETKSMVPA